MLYLTYSVLENVNIVALLSKLCRKCVNYEALKTKVKSRYLYDMGGIWDSELLRLVGHVKFI